MSEQEQDIDKSVLVVAATKEDARFFVEELCDLFGILYTAHSVVTALDIFKSKNTPIVIIDDSIECDDLISLVKECCWENPEVLIAVFFGDENSRLVSEVLQSRVSDVLPKPVDKVAFSDVLSKFTSTLIRREYKKFKPDVFNLVELKLSLTPSSQSVSNSVTLVSRFLSAAISEQDLLRIELGLQEVLRNSFEHGCLGINYEQKRDLIESSNFDSFVEEESQKACAAGRVIDLEARYCSNKVVIKIDDYGNGFDWKVMRKLMESKSPNEGCSGRGLFLMERVFDDVSYNTKGNQTRLTINI